MRWWCAKSPPCWASWTVKGMVRDLADEIAETGNALALKEKLEEVAGTLACHMSVRAGRRLNAEEMNQLLREMEATPHSGQCNHGTSDVCGLKLADIEKLFGQKITRCRRIARAIQKPFFWSSKWLTFSFPFSFSPSFLFFLKRWIVALDGPRQGTATLLIMWGGG